MQGHRECLSRLYDQLAAVTHEEDRYCPLSGALRARGARRLAMDIKLTRYRMEIDAEADE